MNFDALQISIIDDLRTQLAAAAERERGLREALVDKQDKRCDALAQLQGTVQDLNKALRVKDEAIREALEYDEPNWDRLPSYEMEKEKDIRNRYLARLNAALIAQPFPAPEDRAKRMAAVVCLTCHAEWGYCACVGSALVFGWPQLDLSDNPKVKDQDAGKP